LIDALMVEKGSLSLSFDTPEIEPELTMGYPLGNLFDSSQRS